MGLSKSTELHVENGELCTNWTISLIFEKLTLLGAACIIGRWQPLGKVVFGEQSLQRNSGPCLKFSLFLKPRNNKAAHDFALLYLTECRWPQKQPLVHALTRCLLMTQTLLDLCMINTLDLSLLSTLTSSAGVGRLQPADQGHPPPVLHVKFQWGTAMPSSR